MKNWPLFMWALKHLKIENNNYKKCWTNSMLLWLIEVSKVKPEDVLTLYYHKDLTFAGIEKRVS